MKTISDLNTKIFADGADIAGILEMHQRPYISGFTTNPTLMRQAGVNDYKSFAQNVLKKISDKPISFEVFADEFEEMKQQALEISSWGNNVYVKIPVTNTKKEASYNLIHQLSEQGVQLNVTAVMTLEQVREITFALKNTSSSIISIFAGRLADTGLDPVPVMQAALEIMKIAPNTELLWASPREVFNVYQADAIGCHIITATNSILDKLELAGKDLSEFSLETVQMFYNDAVDAGYSL
ncbi:MAG: transaldolase [SAR324 cluster bacterium]|nr:transaldolase [SAR324 cluster bacterium]